MEVSVFNFSWRWSPEGTAQPSDRAARQQERVALLMTCDIEVTTEGVETTAGHVFMSIACRKHSATLSDQAPTRQQGIFATRGLHRHGASLL